MAVELTASIDALRMEIEALRKLLTKLGILGESSGGVEASITNALAPALASLASTVEELRRMPGLRLGNHHEIVELDLSQARSKKLVWTCEKGWKGYPATMFTVCAVPSAFTYAINAVGNGFLDASKGDTVEHEVIERVYVTNAAGSGTGKLRLAGWLPPMVEELKIEEGS